MYEESLHGSALPNQEIVRHMRVHKTSADRCLVIATLNSIDRVPPSTMGCSGMPAHLCAQLAS